MIVTKRQRQTYVDRYGGTTGTDNGGMPLISDFDSIIEMPRGAERTEDVSDFSDANARANGAIGEIKYTTEAAAKPAREETAAPADEEIPDIENKPEYGENDDIMPSIKTRRYATSAAQPTERAAKQKSGASQTKSRGKVTDARTKLMLIVYVCVAVALAIAVIITGISISATNAEADALSSDVSEKRVVLAAREAELATVLDADAIKAKAEDLGMIASTGADTVVDRVEDKGYAAPTERGGAFDDFCDWLSKVIG